mmetsp:Transcript_42/g.35  ORF Transcript_42/g.35 Transcript_42/m.35 type:complete len:101 (+) Transcript_42:1220-1522(+)|eukprot:CAMPEP_0202964574 /NCGR_PEP_ID=MMETSP1396-20130829/8651_1 /ASSEMBLY_ACC=CAM_ASM_000872 /TAXON_ID= /ORGANISM="Pseudokeronopsis sp., Strain Brazil" /LENGTH=100 /DNA_ID=CAMNT_0049686771 /DNA_START=1172 /DNA_END=1474 /DNA_ORIENTATION=+
MGITHSAVPAISINNNEQKVVPYPKEGELSVKALKSWLTKFVKGELKPKESGFGEVIDVDIKYMLQSTEAVKRKKVDEVFFTEGKDVFVFAYTTHMEDET